MILGKFALATALVILIFIGRWLDHPANFAPVSAVAMLATVYLGKRWGPTTALLGMIISDSLIGFYDFKLMAAVYGSFVLIGMMARMLKTDSSWQEILGLSVLASLLFFLVTNAAVWWLTPAYSKDITGLADAYLMGLPFFRNTLLGDLFFTVNLFVLARFYQALDISLVINYNKKV